MIELGYSNKNILWTNNYSSTWTNKVKYELIIVHT